MVNLSISLLGLFYEYITRTYLLATILSAVLSRAHLMQQCAWVARAGRDGGARRAPLTPTCRTTATAALSLSLSLTQRALCTSICCHCTRVALSLSFVPLSLIRFTHSLSLCIVSLSLFVSRSASRLLRPTDSSTTLIINNFTYIYLYC